MLGTGAWISSGAAARSVATHVMPRSAANYDRHRVLPGLLRQGTDRHGAPEPAATLRIVAALANAQRRERARAGGRNYNLDRHIGLTLAIRAEREHLGKIKTPLPQGNGV